MAMAQLRAGIEIKMQPGWKTYWRYPGDSGVPPQFDFSGSENLKTAKVLYPAPHLFTDETGQSLGYKDRVIFPLVISPQQPGKPVRLRLKIDYAVCEKLCVPAEGRAELTLAPRRQRPRFRTGAAEARVPKQVTAAQAGLTVRRVNDGGRSRWSPSISARPPVNRSSLFVEGPTPQWALPIPKPAQAAPAGRAQFSFELDGLPPGVDPKGQFDLTFTVVDRRARSRGQDPSRLIGGKGVITAAKKQYFPQRERTSMPIKVGDRLPDAKFRVMTDRRSRSGRPPMKFSRAIR